MYATLQQVLHKDLAEDLPFIIEAFSKPVKTVVSAEECSKAFIVAINIILKTSPKVERREDIQKLGWKILKGVKNHPNIAKNLVHPNLPIDLLLSKSKSIVCSPTEVKRVARWLTDLSPTVNMAVKQCDVAPNDSIKAELVRLEEILQNLHDNPQSHDSHEVVQWWYRVMNALAFDANLKDLSDIQVIFTITQEVEVAMHRCMDCINNSMIKEDLIFSILRHLYGIISGSGADPSPATSIVLTVIPHSVIGSAIECIIKNNTTGFASIDSNDPGIGLRNALSCLCRWICHWKYTPVLRDWILSLMRGLQGMDKCDVLVDVSMNVICLIFSAMIPPQTRDLVSDIFFYMLSSMRHSTEPFEKIAPHIPKTLELLACDSQNSRQLLQNLVDSLAAMLDEHVELKAKHPDIVQCLDAHIRSNTCSLFTVPLWKISAPVQLNHGQKRIGLVNLGNTCYMNSVLQALLNTRQFSNRVMLNREKEHLMMSLGSLFAMMNFSIRPSVLPQEFYGLSKPPTFIRNGQQDSSEFLCYLLDILHEQEKINRLNKMSSIDMIQSASSSSQSMDIMAIADMSSASSVDIVQETPTSSSAIPCSSSSDEGGTQKRSESNEPLHPLQKRKYTGDAEATFITRAELISATTIVQKTFGGVLSTSIECTFCKVVSKKRDIFRDLQLAFPDKPMATKPMHNKAYSVQELLNYYCSTEKMTGENQYKCDHCDMHRDAERSITIEKAPKNLIIVLKRFLYDPKTQVRAKLLTKVEHNRSISINVGNEILTYELYAAVVHSGLQLDMGHYYTYARDSCQQTWFKYNDHWVSRCQEQDLHDLSPPNTPYILFYKQVESSADTMENLKTGTSAVDSPKSSYNSESSHNNDYDQVLQLNQLPQYLIDLVVNDKSVYLSQSKRETRTTRSSVRSPNYRRDSDDDPSSSNGGSNDVSQNYNNRYIY